MAKAIVVTTNTDIQNTTVYIGYQVSIIGPPNYNFSSIYIVNTGISVAANLTAWKNKIIVEVSEKGPMIAATDIIMFGSPT